MNLRWMTMTCLKERSSGDYYAPSRGSPTPWEAVWGPHVRTGRFMGAQEPSDDHFMIESKTVDGEVVPFKTRVWREGERDCQHRWKHVQRRVSIGPRLNRAEMLAVVLYTGAATCTFVKAAVSGKFSYCTR